MRGGSPRPRHGRPFDEGGQPSLLHASANHLRSPAAQASPHKPPPPRFSPHLPAHAHNHDASPPQKNTHLAHPTHMIRSPVFQSVVSWAHALMADTRPEAYTLPDGQNTQNRQASRPRAKWFPGRGPQAADMSADM